MKLSEFVHYIGKRHLKDTILLITFGCWGVKNCLSDISVSCTRISEWRKKKS